MHHGASGTGAAMNDMNWLYKKLIKEQRDKKIEAEKNLHLWRKQHVGKNGEGAEVEDGVPDSENMPPDVVAADLASTREALQMLPEHVVMALKEKYETDDGATALAKALEEEEEGGDGKGALAQLMELPPSPTKIPPTANEEEKKDEPPLPVMEQLSIQEKLKPPPPDCDRILQTKRFYNTHSSEYISKLTSLESTLTPTQHRDTFLAHLQTQQQELNTTNDVNVDTNNIITLLDLGCGYGRDTLHFSQLGHNNIHVLGIDYSYQMLNHAKTMAPHAHYLNMDMRFLKNVLVDQSVDGIWACASLLHLPKVDVVDVLKGLFVAVKVGGVLYLSFKVNNDDNDGGIEEVKKEVDEEKGENDTSASPSEEKEGENDTSSSIVEEKEEDNVATSTQEEEFNADSTSNSSNNKTNNVPGEVFDIDERYTAMENTTTSNNPIDSRYKLYSYYTVDEVKELLGNTGWDIMDIGQEDDLREKSGDYVQHSFVYAFATRRNE